VLELGALEFLKKPIDQEQLTEVLGQLNVIGGAPSAGGRAGGIAISVTCSMPNESQLDLAGFHWMLEMFQNITLIPLTGTSGEVSHICLIVYDVTDVAMSKQAITAANAKLERLSRTDRLTGLNNRGYWEECLAAEFRRFARTGQKATLVMFDIDHFKKVNDTHGHSAGDAVICTIAKLLARCMRDTDIGGRYGGEEFAVVLVDTDLAAADDG
jgi:predicted signal transduction protein with EAL and GGDEF domain